MKRRYLIISCLSLGLLLGRNSAAHAVSIALDLDLTNISFTATGKLTITAAPLPAQAFFGKNVVIPVTLTSDAPKIDTQNLQVEMVYQMVDASGAPLAPLTTVPIQFERNSQKQNILNGTAVIPRQNLLAAKNKGSLKYYFHARQGTQDVYRTTNPVAGIPAFTGSPGNAPLDAFQVSFVDTLRAPVSNKPVRVSIPDTQAVDGKTSVFFDQDALSGPGTLVVHQEDVDSLPAGGLTVKPIAAYTMTLEGTSLTRTAQLTLTYPAETNGSLIGSPLNPGDLGLYWFENPYGWRLLSRPVLDSTLHTVSATTPHFSLFALLPAGATGGADLRPKERIITPNGDGVNDVAVFGTGIDEVHIFDLRGRRIRTLTGPTPAWDGKGDDGKIVESGIYLYQFMSQGDRVSGVISVAK